MQRQVKLIIFLPCTPPLRLKETRQKSWSNTFWVILTVTCHVFCSLWRTFSVWLWSHYVWLSAGGFWSQRKVLSSNFDIEVVLSIYLFSFSSQLCKSGGLIAALWLKHKLIPIFGLPIHGAHLRVSKLTNDHLFLKTTKFIKHLSKRKLS